MKKIFLASIVLILLISMTLTSCSEPEKSAKLIFNESMTVEEIVKVFKLMKVDDVPESEFMYFNNENIIAFSEESIPSVEGEIIGIYFNKLEPGSGFRVEGIYENENISLDEKILERAFLVPSIIDIHIRYFASEDSTERGVVLGFVKLLEEVGYEFSGEEIDNIINLING